MCSSDLGDLKPKELLEQRHARLNAFGRYTDTKADSSGRERSPA